MFQTRKKITQIILAMMIASVSAIVPAESQLDHDKARQALESGQILPLRVILEKIEQQYPGQVLEVELEKSHGSWIYELKVLQQSGKLIKLKIDAGNATVLKKK